jgi:putative membrane protein
VRGLPAPRAPCSPRADPFGYDKNDLNMDHFCANIIRSELAALSAAPPPDLAAWAFAPANDRVLMGVRPPTMGPGAADGPASPNEWVRRGSERMRRVLAAQA